MSGQHKQRPGTMIYFEMVPVIDQLPDATAGKFWKAIMHFARDGTEPDFSDDQLLTVLWPMVRERITRDNEKYLAVCLSNSERRKYGAYKAKREKAGRDVLPFSEWKERQDETFRNNTSWD